MAMQRPILPIHADYIHYVICIMGTNTRMGKAKISCDTCMSSPYAYGQPIRVYRSRNIAHTRIGCPYAYGITLAYTYGQNTRMGRNSYT